MLSGRLYQQPRWEHRISETDSLLWPTPTQDTGERTKKYQQGGTSLSMAVKTWPTPRVSDTEGGIVKNVEMKDGAFSRVNKDGVRWGVKLKDAVSHTESGGQLNPMWVEWLMGWPIGWTDLKPLAMDKFQEWLKLHGKYYRTPLESITPLEI